MMKKIAKRFHHENLSEFEVDEIEEEEVDTSTISNRLSEAYSLFVSGEYSKSEKLLKSKETWLREYIISYFENIEHFSYSSVTKVPYDFLTKNIIKMPYSSTAMTHGTNVHNALEKIVSGKAKLEDYKGKEELKAIKKWSSSFRNYKK